MNIYLLTRKDDYKSYEYISCIVYAETEDRAKLIHPDGRIFKEHIKGKRKDWCKESDIEIELIGYSDNKKHEEGLILSCFQGE